MLIQKIGIVLVVFFLSCKEKKSISINQNIIANKSNQKDKKKIIVKLDTVFLGDWQTMYVIGPYGGELRSILLCKPPAAQIEKIKKTSEKMNVSEAVIYLFFDKDNNSREIKNPSIAIYTLSNLKDSCFTYSKESICSAIVF